MTCGEHSPCLNGGTCVAIVHSWETFCHCPVGWEGVRCEEGIQFKAEVKLCSENKERYYHQLKQI